MRVLKIIILIFTFTPVYAAQIIPRYQIENYNKDIIRLYRINIYPKDIIKKVEIFSRFFLGKPYYLGALGEGQSAEFDKSPLYRTDRFDCDTYVSAVLALAEANNLRQFQKTIKKVRYQNAEVSYLNRNHFTSIDWNKNNIKNGYLKDITRQFINPKGRPVFALATAYINKPMWYKMKKADTIKYFTKLPKEKEQKLLTNLHDLANKVTVEKSVIPYIPLTTLFKNNKPNNYLFNQIPSGAVIEIIRPNWDLTKTIGTHLNVSHMGLAIRTKNGLVFREASFSEKYGKKIIDISLTTYLKSCLNSPTIKGINVQQIIMEK